MADYSVQIFLNVKTFLLHVYVCAYVCVNSLESFLFDPRCTHLTVFQVLETSSFQQNLCQKLEIKETKAYSFLSLMPGLPVFTKHHLVFHTPLVLSCGFPLQEYINCPMHQLNPYPCFEVLCRQETAVLPFLGGGPYQPYIGWQVDGTWPLSSCTLRRAHCENHTTQRHSNAQSLHPSRTLVLLGQIYVPCSKETKGKYSYKSPLSIVQET